MDRADRAIRTIRSFYKKNSDPLVVEKYSRFFREGYRAYGVNPEIQSKEIQKWIDQLEDEFTLKDYKKLFVGLFESGMNEETSTVIRFLTNLERYYSKSLFAQIRAWIGKYFTNWAQTDSVCKYVLREFILRKIVSYNDLIAWHTHKSKWVRRAVPVTTVEAFYKEQKITPVLKVGNLLIDDPVREVGQGVGWMLRDAWKIYPDRIEKLLKKHVKTGNRTAYQYACEKMDKEYRLQFRRPKK